MQSKTIKKAIELSQKMIEEWFSGVPSLVLSLIDDNILWIGSTANQFYQGKKEVLEALKKANDSIVPCTVTEQEWSIPDKGTNYCICVGRYICTLDTPTMFMQEPQRVTFVWKTVQNNLKITHIHLSNVMHAVRENEEFPVEASKRNYAYVQKKLSSRNRIIHLTTTEYEYSLVSLDRIIYVEAAKDNITVYTDDKNYRIHDRIGNFVEKNCPDFIFIHRSYAVNPDWIKSVTPSEAVLVNGERLAIPSRRSKEICEKLKERFG